MIAILLGLIGNPMHCLFVGNWLGFSFLGGFIVCEFLVVFVT